MNAVEQDAWAIINAHLEGKTAILVLRSKRHARKVMREVERLTAQTPVGLVRL